MKTKLAHIFGLLVAVLGTVVPIWNDSSNDLAAKISLSIVTFLGLCFNHKIKGQIENYLLAFAAPSIMILTFVLLHTSNTSKLFAIAGLSIAVLTNLQKILPPRSTIVSVLALVVGSLIHASPSVAGEATPLPAQATYNQPANNQPVINQPVDNQPVINQPTDNQAQTGSENAKANPNAPFSPIPNLLAPPISFCFGQSTTCVMPDFTLSVVSYDLDAKKWTGEIQTIAVGYMLLFAADQPYASGIAIHGGGQFQQSGPKYFTLIPTLVIARYLEVGAAFQFADGSIGKFITLGLGAGFDLITGATMGERLKAKAPTTP